MTSDYFTHQKSDHCYFLMWPGFFFTWLGYFKNDSVTFKNDPVNFNVTFSFSSMMAILIEK